MIASSACIKNYQIETEHLQFNQANLSVSFVIEEEGTCSSVCGKAYRNIAVILNELIQYLY